MWKDRLKVYFYCTASLFILGGSTYVTAQIISGKPLGDFMPEKFTNILALDAKATAQDKATMEQIIEDSNAKSVEVALFNQEYKKFAKLYSPKVANQKAGRLVEKIMQARRQERELFNQHAQKLADADDAITPITQGILPIASTASPFMPSAQSLAAQNATVESFKNTVENGYKKIKGAARHVKSKFSGGDADRHAILSHELSVKQHELKSALSTGDDKAIRRIQGDIAAIRKEFKL